MKQLLNDISEIDKTILPWLGKTTKALDFHIADTFEKEGINLTKAQIIILKVLTMNDGIPQINLAFVTNRNKTSLTRLIHTMEKKGFVERRLNGKDKRVNLVFITGSGKNMLRMATPILMNIIKEIVQGIDKIEIDSTIEVLKKISKNINADFMTASIK